MFARATARAAVNQGTKQQGETFLICQQILRNKTARNVRWEEEGILVLASPFCRVKFPLL